MEVRWNINAPVPISVESREAYTICMKRESMKLAVPMGLITAFVTNSMIRYQPRYIRAITMSTCGFIAYISGKFLYSPVCAEKYVPELNQLLREDIHEFKGTNFEPSSIEQDPISNDYYSNADDNRNQFDDMNNDIDIDDKPIDLKPQKPNLTYDDLRKQHRAMTYVRKQSYEPMVNARPRLQQDAELLEDDTTLKTGSTEGNVWY